MSSCKIAIIGGGIAGLSAALKLHDCAKADNTPIEYRVFEASNRAGGIIESRTTGGCTLELGADSFITNKPWGIDLVRRLDLQDQIEPTNKQWRRTFIARGKTLYPLPDGFRLIAPTDICAFLKSPLLSYAGRARVLMDMIIPPRNSNQEETVADFARRRLGVEALERIVQPMIGGIYVGDVERLSLQATMPWLSKLELEYGSLIKGLQTAGGSGTADGDDTTGGVRYGMFVSLRGGLQKLVDAIIAQLPGHTLKLGSRIKQIRLCNESLPPVANPKYELLTNDGEKQVFDAIIMTLPAYHAANLVAVIDSKLSQELAQIEYASSAILNLVYKRLQIPHALNGFGFVVPPGEKRSITACTFSSVKFPGRAPADTAVLRVFMGGTFNPNMVEFEDQLLMQLAGRDLENFLGITTKPLLVNVSRYPNAMPQYVIGHNDRVQRIMKRLEALHGLAAAGSAYHGVGVPDCIHSGQLAAQKIHTYLTGASREFVSTV